MTTVEEIDDVNEAVEDFFHTFERPVTTASRFYTFLYLSDVKGRDEFDFDLFKLKNRLADDFINYTVYAVAREIGHKRNKLNINNIDVRTLASRRLSNRAANSYSEYEKKTRQTDIPHPSAFIENQIQALRDHIIDISPNDEPQLAIDILLDETFRIRRGIDLRNAKRTLGGLENRHKIMSKPVKFLNAAKTIFELDYHSIGSDTQYGKYLRMETRNAWDAGWIVEYGGSAWASVCDSATLFQDFSDKAYVDMMFSVEHNNGNFLNKLPEIADEEGDTLSSFFPLIRGNSFKKRGVFNIILPNVLDAAKDENIRPLYKIAKSVDTNLHVRSLDEDDFPEEESLLQDDVFGDGDEADSGGEIL